MLDLGTVVDRYRIEAVVASGGMATVYRVRHVQLGSEHALKVLDLPNASLKERLLTEGQVQARLNHPNLVRVTDIVPVNDAFGLVMEFVNGPTLEEWIAGLGAWPEDAQRRAERVAECERLFRGILSAVAYAHRKGLVHRDLKPQNVLLEDNDGVLNPKVLDFGIAKLLQDEKAGGITRTGWGMGTPEYMAPEQLKAAKDVDARADIWALGCILYAMYAGKSPFAREDLLQTFAALGTGQHEALEDLHPTLPPRLGNAVRACLQVTRERRIADCSRLSLLLTGEIAPGGDATEEAVNPATSTAPPTPTLGAQISAERIAAPPAAARAASPAYASPTPPPPPRFASAPPPPSGAAPTAAGSSAPSFAPDEPPAAGKTISSSMYLDGSADPGQQGPIIGKPSLPPPSRGTGGTLDVPPDDDPFAAPPPPRGRWLLYAGIGVVALGCAAAVAVAAFLAWQSDSRAPDAADAADAATAEVQPPTAPAPQAVTPPGAHPAAVPAAQRVAEVTPAPAPTPAAAPAAKSPDSQRPVTAPVTPAAPAPLSDDAEIATMLKKVLTAHAGEADACFASRAADAPDLAGSWRLELTAQPDGSASEISVQPTSGTGDPALEACIGAAAARWRFSPIEDPQPVTKTFRFASANPSQGALVITGDASDAWLSGGGNISRGGKLPAGSYTWSAKFGEEEVPGGMVTVAAGQTVTLDCRAAFVSCTVK